MISLLMVISYLHVISVPIFPAKTDAILAIDPNCMLPCAILFKGMKLIPRRNFEIIQPRCGIDHL